MSAVVMIRPLIEFPQNCQAWDYVLQNYYLFFDLVKLKSSPTFEVITE
jgi:hypothetical protein